MIMQINSILGWVGYSETHMVLGTFAIIWLMMVNYIKEVLDGVS